MIRNAAGPPFGRLAPIWIPFWTSLLGLLLAGCGGSSAAPREAGTIVLSAPTVTTSGDQLMVDFGPLTTSRAVIATTDTASEATEADAVTTDAVTAEEADGSVLVVRGERFIAGYRPEPAARLSVYGNEIVASASEPRPVTIAVVRDLVQDAAWATVDGRPSLRVTPTDAARGWKSAAAVRAGWLQVLDRAPSADTPGMAEQYRCHVEFSPAKASYDLEPWRPALGYPTTVLNLCNTWPDQP